MITSTLPCFLMPSSSRQTKLLQQLNDFFALNKICGIIFFTLIFPTIVWGQGNCSCQQYAYLPDFGTNTVHKFRIDDVTGAFTEIGSPWLSINAPHGIAFVQNTGNILISDFATYNYDLYNCSGSKLADNVIVADGPYNGVTIGDVLYIIPRNSGCILHAYNLCDYSLIGEINLANCDFRNWGIDLGTDGYLYVTDNYRGGAGAGAGNIYKIDPNVNNFTLPGTTTVSPFITGLNVLFGVTVDNSGNIYVVEQQSNTNYATTIKKFSSTGTLLCSVTDAVNESSGTNQGFYNGWGIEWDEIHDVLYVSTFDDDCIASISTDCPMTYLEAAVNNAPGSDAKGLRLQKECCYTPTTDVINVCSSPGVPIALNDVIGCVLCSGVYTRTAGTGGSYDNCNLTFTPDVTTTNTTYTYTSSASTCGNVSITINISTTGITVTSTQTDVLCFGDSTGAIDISASGGAGSYTYDWADITNTNNIEDRTGLAAGTYTVTVSDNNGCENVYSATINEPLAILDATCTKTDATTNGGADGTASTSATGGTAPYTYLWSNGATTASITGLTAGTYTVTVTDLNGCTAICSVTVQEPGCNLSANATGTDVSCNAGTDGTAAATATGNLVPVTYLWSNGETTASITGLVTGTYTVTVTETPTCTAVASYTVTEPLAMDAACSKTNATTIGGADGTASVIATGGTAPYTYLWSNGETTASITGLTAGTYTVTVTDLNGCTAICSVTVQEPGCNLSASTTGNETNVSCNGGSNGAIGVTATGNLVPVTYLWSNGETTASITGLTAGTYTVTVTETPTCTAVASYTVTEPTLLDAACTKTDATTIGGNQGTASTSATGGTAPYTYLWSNGATTASITGLTAGTYSVTVTDANGCTAICSVTIQEPGCPPAKCLPIGFIKN